MHQKIDQVLDLVAATTVDEEAKKIAINNISNIKNVLSLNSINAHNFHQISPSFVGPNLIMTLLFLVNEVEKLQSYPKLTDEDIRQIRDQIAQLSVWLKEHQLAEDDFVRQALIIGCDELDFRLQRFKWFGYAYTISSLKDIIAAYMAIERGVDPTMSPDAQAMLNKTAALIRLILDRVGLAKDIWENGDFLLKGYGLLQLTIQGSQGIAALLPHMK